MGLRLKGVPFKKKKKKKCVRMCETFKNMYIIINYIQNFCFLKCPAYIK